MADTADTIIFRSLFRWGAAAVAFIMIGATTCSWSDDRKKERMAVHEAASFRARADEARAKADEMHAREEIEKAYTERIRIEHSDSGR